jgi:hypothetical protein
MIINCTLSNWAVPGFPELTPEFGAKKPDGNPITAREHNRNAMMPFSRQRPFIVSENSSTTPIEANAVFSITSPGICLTLGNGAFTGCTALVINTAGSPASLLINGATTPISIAHGEIIDLAFVNGEWKRTTTPEQRNILPDLALSDFHPRAVSNGETINVGTGGRLSLDGCFLNINDIVCLKDQSNPVENGFWSVQSGSWIRYLPSDDLYAELFYPIEGEQAYMIFFLSTMQASPGDDAIHFEKTIYTAQPRAGKVPIYNAHAKIISNDYRSTHGDVREDMGRDLRDVLGITAIDPVLYIPQIMAELQMRCSVGHPEGLSGLEVGDYIDGLDLSGISTDGIWYGTIPQDWYYPYKNNRIVIAGFNTYRNVNWESSSNHIVFTFRNSIAYGIINEYVGTLWYMNTAIHNYLENRVAPRLEQLFSINISSVGRRIPYGDSEMQWAHCKLFLPTEEEVFGSRFVGKDFIDDGLKIQLPIYAKSLTYRIKKYNGWSCGWWLATKLRRYFYDFESFDEDKYYVLVHDEGFPEFQSVNNYHGISPVFCIGEW